MKKNNPFKKAIDNKKNSKLNKLKGGLAAWILKKKKNG